MKKKGIYSLEHRRIVEKLKTARQEAGMSQAQVAKGLQSTQSYVSKLESGQSKIDVIEISRLAQLYKKPVDFFLR
jgi:transcriptional regulator with XRE-family HTH domain